MTDTVTCRNPDQRSCPGCAGSGEDIVFRIDDTAECYVCGWTGHEDSTLVCSDPCECEDNCRCCMDRDCPRHGAAGRYAYYVYPKEES